jgi:type IV pilus assembly protein PilY1
VIDRFYVIRDSEKNPPTYPLTEVNLVDVTKDELQSDAYTDEEKSNIRAKLTPPNYTDGTSNYYGWYIKHDQNPGEKVLAVPKVFSGVVYYTTYQSATIEDSDDPCVGKLGPSRLYAVKAMTGEAAYNFYEGNDGTDTETGKVVVVLNRDDRSIKIGDGIASEPLILVNSDGAVSVMAGRGGGFFNSGNVENIDPIFPVYWMKW